MVIYQNKMLVFARVEVTVMAYVGINDIRKCGQPVLEAKFGSKCDSPHAGG